MKDRIIMDFHTHILPGIDDGCEDASQSLSLLKMLEQQGIEIVNLTPHFYAHRKSYEKFLNDRAKAFEILKANYNGSIKFVLGAEVNLNDALMNLDSVDELKINNTDYMLTEFPYDNPKKGMRSLEHLVYNENVIPVLAHLDRFPEIFKDKSIMNKFFEWGCKIQINTLGINGKISGEIKKLLKASVVDFIGTDTHRPNFRPPETFEITEYITKKKLDTFAQINKNIKLIIND